MSPAGDGAWGTGPRAPCSAHWAPMGAVALGLGWQDSRTACPSPHSAAACWHPRAALTCRGDPIREVISRHDSSFPCSLPWRHADLDRNSCLCLIRRIPARDHWEPWHPPPHLTELRGPPSPLPHPSGLPSCPPAAGSPVGAKCWLPESSPWLMPAHPQALGARGPAPHTPGPPSPLLPAHCASLRLIPAHAGISAAYTAPHGI